MSKSRQPLIPYILNSDFNENIIIAFDVILDLREFNVPLLSEETGLSLGEVLSVVNSLNLFDLFSKENKQYILNGSIDLLTLASLLEYGIEENKIRNNFTIIDGVKNKIFNDIEVKDITALSYLLDEYKIKYKEEKVNEINKLLELKKEEEFENSEIFKISEDLEILYHSLDEGDLLIEYVLDQRKAFNMAKKLLRKSLGLE